MPANEHFPLTLFSFPSRLFQRLVKELKEMIITPAIIYDTQKIYKLLIITYWKMRIIPILTLIVTISAIAYSFFPNPSIEGKAVANIVETSTSTIQVYIVAEEAANCYDSDSGLNIYSSGYMNYSGLISYDTCLQNNELIEKYCSDGSPTSLYTKCPANYTCMNSRCQPNSLINP